MRFSFLPKMMVPALPVLTEALLKQKNIRLLMLDFDNTIVPYTTNTPAPEIDTWLRAMAVSDIKLCVVSNSRKERVKRFCGQYGIACITHAKKPFSKGIRQCLAQFDLPGQVCALAGDQIFTDTLGANCAGVQSILVKPIHNHNIWLKVRHALEQPFIWLAGQRRI